jgi:chorismate mutase
MSDDSDKLADLRQQIDALDGQLLQLLAQRMDHVREIGEYKKAHSLPPLDAERWQSVLATRLAEAKALGLSEDLVTQLYQIVHEYALSIEASIEPS